MRKLLRRLGNVDDPRSLSNRLRRQRFEAFRALMATVPTPARVLDVGGTERFWDQMGIDTLAGVEIHLLNLRAAEARDDRFVVHAGDATDMSQFADGSFDVVFSNSVIEHVGDLGSQQRMAREVRRVGARFWVQTPCRWFPIEPHYFLPFFGVLPLGARAWMLHRFGARPGGKRISREDARERAQRVRLMRRAELRDAFPTARIDHERVLGLTKSWIVRDGWTTSDAHATS
jgi:hypothetical protein